MYNAILCRYHEIAIKGNNRSFFEKKLMENIHYRLRHVGKFHVARVRGRVWVEKRDGGDFTEEEFPAIKAGLEGVFGLESFSAVMKIPPTLEAMKAAARAIAPELFAPFRDLTRPVKFRIRARRSDKDFPLDSTHIEIELMTAVAEVVGRERIQVDLSDAELTLGCELRQEFACVFSTSCKAPGGLPVGSNTGVVALLSGGIDSPVACYLAMKRGCPVEFLSFHSAPYTPEATTDKIKRIAAFLNAWQYPGRLHLCNLSELQKLIRDHCDPRMRTVLYRRAMLRIGEKLAGKLERHALLTGDSVGQVASQTVVNMGTINAAVKILVIRPLACFDKLESIAIAEKIGSFELSREQVPDSCTVFAPSSPATGASVERAEAEEAKIPDYAAVLDRLFGTMDVVTF